MKPHTLFNASCLLLSCLLAGNAHAELYKWVGADGKITYSDVPPPANAKQVERKNLSIDNSSVPFPAELAAAVAQNPVTLYTSETCTPCNEGRALLKQQGIPFSEKTVSSNDDIAKLKQAGGDTQLPLLVIKNSKFRGFNSTEWRTALSSAGYPDTSKLPKEYRYPAAESAAPAPAPKTKNTPEKAPPESNRKSESDTGIRF